MYGVQRLTRHCPRLSVSRLSQSVRIWHDLERVLGSYEDDLLYRVPERPQYFSTVGAKSGCFQRRFLGSMQVAKLGLSPHWRLCCGECQALITATSTHEGQSCSSKKSRTLTWRSRVLLWWADGRQQDHSLPLSVLRRGIKMVRSRNAFHCHNEAKVAFPK